MILILLILIFCFTGGSMSALGYYFKWNSLYHCILFPTIQRRWLWLGTIDQYRKYLDEERKRLDNL